MKREFNFLRKMLPVMASGVLFCTSFNVFAQTKTPLQARLATKNNFGKDTIQLGGYDGAWYVIKKEELNNIEYTFLISYKHLNSQNTVEFCPMGDYNLDYTTSTLRNEMNTEYKYIPNALREIAVVANLGNNVNITSSVSKPTEEKAGNSPSNSKYVLFAPSYKEVSDWNISLGCSATSFCKEIKNYYWSSHVPNGRWWTRSTDANTKDHKFEVNPGAGTFVAIPVQGGKVCMVGAIWVQSGVPYAGDYTITYKANNGTAESDYLQAENSTNGNVTIKTASLTEANFSTPKSADFLCWNTKADGSGTAIAADATMLIHSDTTLYAQWKYFNETCEGDSVTLEANVVNGGKSPNYQWHVNSIEIAGANKTNFTYMPNHGDVVTCVVISSADCADTMIANTVTILLKPKPVPPAVATPFDLCTVTGNPTLVDIPVQDPDIQWYLSELGNDPIDLNTLIENERIYWVSQTVNGCESKRSYVKIEKSCHTLYGTVFPFIHSGDADFDTLFKVTARLYATSQIEGQKNIAIAFRRTKPLKETEAVYYDGAVFVPTTPLHPGEVGSVNNPGLPIKWEKLGYSQTREDTATVTRGNNRPDRPIGLYTFENVEEGEYILTLSAPGFVTRYAKIKVDNDHPLGHRELIPGDFDNNGQIDQRDITIGNAMKSKFTDKRYKIMYDVNRDKVVNREDITFLTNTYYGFIWLLYEESWNWKIKH